MITLTRKIGALTLAGLTEMGRMFNFILYAFYIAIKSPGHPRHVLKQMIFIGVRSSFVIVLTAAFTGMVLGLQGYYTLTKFGSEGMLGVAVALSLIRELGPVLSALMVTGRAGSAISAEIGIMRISEQIDALETMALEPFKYLVAPKLVASLLALPLLCAIFDVVGIWGGYLVGVKLLGVNPGAYFGEMQKSVEWKDVYSGVIKSVCFGGIVSWICCYKGYYTGHGAEGVSRATTTAVVMSSVMILIWDYFITSVLL
ncbi:MlaE family lipid ABC transporter permease subunit [Geomonas sp. Red32]|uniref:MlaE family ABC transporter permease n=1 Tax=Geomonas sp. Red32 TaxID=2912856 RepID=UPI00202CA914|nr:MlaE family lipid ABC transporter permease subunit [Geomonas sp. Red32]MCM0082744.1 MlaE family lipid ABC transporter permease subunit [Geomonas sp. Red32]